LTEKGENSLKTKRHRQRAAKMKKDRVKTKVNVKGDNKSTDKNSSKNCTFQKITTQGEP
jgi:hypothetical protein